jgi:hypothetical protein
MGWAIGYDESWKRDIGYGVPAKCDYPGCGADIDRGLGYVCGGEPYGGAEGCGLFFCGKHRSGAGLCCQCQKGTEPFEATPDTLEWIQWKLTHESWQTWRDENPEEVAKLRAQVQHTAEHG